GGNAKDAAAAVSRARTFAQRSHDKEVEIASRLEAARIDATTGTASQREAATQELRNLMLIAKKDGYRYTSFEARLSLGILQKGPGRADLLNLRQEASNAGFTLIADRAASELRN